MATTVGQLEIKMIAGMARLEADMKKGNRIVKKHTDSMARAANQLKKVLGALALAFGIRAIGRFVSGILDAQDKLAKLSQKVNISVESLAGWQHAADLSGSSLSGLTKGMKSLTTQMFDANDGLLESQRNFSKLNIEVANADGTLRDADLVMIEIADKFAAMKDGAEKTALAVKIFGKAGLDLIPMLNQGSDALREMREEGQLLNPVTAESARNSELFNDNMDRLTKSLKVGFIGALNEMLPLLVFLTNELFNVRRQALEAGEAMSPLVRGMMDVAEWAGLSAMWISGLAIEIAGMKEIFEATLHEGAEGAAAARDRVSKRMKQSEADALNFQSRMNAMRNKAPNDLITNDDLERIEIRDRPGVRQMEFDVPTGKTVDPIAKANEAAFKYLETLRKAEAFAIDSSNEAKARWEIERGNLKLADDVMHALILTKARERDGTLAAIEAEKIIAGLKEESALQQQDAIQETLRIQEAQKAQDIIIRDQLINRWQNEKETIEDQRDEELDLLQELWDKKLISENNFLEMRLRMIMEFDEKRADAERRSMTESEKFTASSWQNKTATIFGELSSLSAGVSTHSRKMFELNKVAGISEAIISAYTGISRTLGAYPYPFNIAMAAAHGVAAFAQVSAIAGTQFQGGGAGAAPSLAGSTPATPVTPVGSSNQPSAQTTIINFKGTQDERAMVRRFAKMLNENTHDGGKVLIN